MKTVIIVGTTSGLGLELTNLLLRSETSLITINRHLPSAKLPSGNLRASIFYDLRNPGFDFSEIPEELIANVGEVVLVLNAATISPLGPTLEISTNSLEESFRNNFFGYISLVQEFASASSRFGYKLRIFWVGTGATDQIIPGWYAYSASKAALKSYLLFISKENPTISIEIFEPGIFQSKMQDEISLFHLGRNEHSQKLPSPEISASILANLILD